jgi:hypothetical protein
MWNNANFKVLLFHFLIWTLFKVIYPSKYRLERYFKITILMKRNNNWFFVLGLFTAYIGDDDKTEKTFSGQFYLTGDRGFVDKVSLSSETKLLHQKSRFCVLCIFVLKTVKLVKNVFFATLYKKSVVVQNKSSLLLKIFLYNKWTLQLIKLIKMESIYNR